MVMVRFAMPTGKLPNSLADRSFELRGEDLGLVYSRNKPTEIQIHNPLRGIISADVRSVELDMDGATISALNP